MGTKQNWTAGQTVKVGFTTLVVAAKVATPGDWAPDAYILTNNAGTQLYKFVPHNGLSKLTITEARELLARQAQHVINEALAVIAKAKADATAFTSINQALAGVA